MTTPAAAAAQTIAAPAVTIWHALNDAEQLGRWLLPAALGASLAREGEDLFVSMGPMRAALLRATVLEQRRRLRWSGLPDDQTSALLGVAALDDGRTQVEVALEGYAALPALPREDRAAGSAAAWRMALENLAAHIAGAALPWPDGHLTALFGYRRAEPHQAAVERSVLVNVPIARAWAAVSTPAGIESWFSPGTPWQLTELAPGGRLFVRSEEGGELYTQLVAQVQSPHLLVLQTPPDDAGFYDKSDYALRSEGGGTRVSLTYAGFDKLPPAERPAAMEQTAFGFGMVMENLRAAIEGGPLPVPGGF